MRTILVLLSAVLCTSNSWLFAARQAGGQAGQPDSPSAPIDQLAQSIFSSSDGNHNHVLNKIEFKNAHAMLETAVDDWGRAGLIGKPKKPQNKDKQVDGRAILSPAASFNKLAKSNKVSQAEFAFYAHAFVAEADERWRQMNLMGAAQRKAYNAQRAAFRRRGVRVPVPFPF